MKHLFAAMALGAATPILAQSGDPTVLFAGDDPKMQAAIAAARDTLPLFYRNALSADGFGIPGAGLKVAFAVEAPDMESEIIWVGPVKREADGSFTGALANEPNAMPGLHLGDAVAFDAGMIADWSYWTEGGTGYGNYTTRVVLEAMPKAEAAALRAMLSDTPVPPGWE